MKKIFFLFFYILYPQYNAANNCCHNNQKPPPSYLSHQSHISLPALNYSQQNIQLCKFIESSSTSLVAAAWIIAIKYDAYKSFNITHRQFNQAALAFLLGVNIISKYCLHQYNLNKTSIVQKVQNEMHDIIFALQKIRIDWSNAIISAKKVIDISTETEECLNIAYNYQSSTQKEKEKVFIILEKYNALEKNLKNFYEMTSKVIIATQLPFEEINISKVEEMVMKMSRENFILQKTLETELKRIQSDLELLHHYE